jgi:uncharacterized protein
MTILGRLPMSLLLVFAFGTNYSVLAADTSQAAKPAEHYDFNRPPLTQKRFARLPFGSVLPEGWLKRQIQLEADGMARRLLDPKAFDQILGPCKQNGESEVTYQQGVYQEGIITLAFLTRDEVFLKRARESMEKTLAEDPTDLGKTQGNLDAVLYKRSRQIRGFVEYYEAARDERILAWLTVFYHAWGKSDRKLSWWPESATTDLFLTGVWLYNKTGDPAILDAIKAKSGFVDPVADSFLRFPQGDYEKHNVVVAWISRLPGIIYQVKPDDRYREATFKGIAGRDQWYGQIGGRYTGHEHFCTLEDGRRPTNGTELCGVIEYMYSMEKLFEIFGEVSLADRLELLAYNALPGGCTADFFYHQYDQQANQVNISVAKRGFDNSETANLYGLAPHYPCCSFNWHHAWPRLVEHLWMATPDRGLVAVAYGPCRVETTVADGQSVSITETTDYPFDGSIRLQLKMKAPVKFPLYLRIPGWAEGATCTYRGKKVACTKDSFFKAEFDWQPDDECLLTLPMDVRIEPQYNNSIAVLRGPLYFSLRIGQSYRDLGNKESWEILPTTPWNYGLELAGKTAKNVKVVQNPVGDFPFAGRGEPLFRRSPDAVVNADGQVSAYTREPYAPSEPIVLKVKGRLFPNWDMDKTFPANAADPPASPAVSSQPETELELVPYGCARLRISVFPWLKPEASGK